MKAFGNSFETKFVSYYDCLCSVFYESKGSSNTYVVLSTHLNTTAFNANVQTTEQESCYQNGTARIQLEMAENP